MQLKAGNGQKEYFIIIEKRSDLMGDYFGNKSGAHANPDKGRRDLDTDSNHLEFSRLIIGEDGCEGRRIYRA